MDRRLTEVGSIKAARQSGFTYTFILFFYLTFFIIILNKNMRRASQLHTALFQYRPEFRGFLAYSSRRKAKEQFYRSAAAARMRTDVPAICGAP